MRFSDSAFREVCIDEPQVNADEIDDDLPVLGGVLARALQGVQPGQADGGLGQVVPPPGLGHLRNHVHYIG
ncbi:hypothetical protein Skr01_10240 [Sphaerisporangium krabiense]|nr:hypothetical protein Skr01_10240 [Sphaerisporangium krabiense]